MTNPELACYMFQNGELQPIACSLAPAPAAAVGTANNQSQPQQSSPRTPSVTPSIPNNTEAKNSKPSGLHSNNTNVEVLKAINKRDGIVS